MKSYVSFATVGCIMSMIFFMVVNYLTSPNTLWFIYPCFFLLLWPISLYFVYKKSLKHFSFICSFVIIAFLLTENLIHTPDYLWFFYAAYPLLWWPILMYLGEKSKSLLIAIIGCLTTIIYYSSFNFLGSHEYPWAIYPSFAVIWWPLSIYHAKRKNFAAFSFNAFLLISIFFITINIVSSPNTVWAIYPIFAVSWWPLTMYFYVYKKRSIV